MALCEADGLRLLFDPLLEERHHGGVFEVVPRREIDVEALRPDYVLVSHRHPDHFDVRSLRRLAGLDPDSVVITPDPLVAGAARRVGFRTAHVVDPAMRLELDTLLVATTPSRANDAPIAEGAIECGFAVGSGGDAVWNLVDTVHEGAAALGATVDAFESALSARLALALVPWCPLLEVGASLAGDIGFPFRAYAKLLDDAAALAARGAAIVAASSGARHAPPWTAMNALVYPVDEARFLADLAARAPGVRAFGERVGDALVIEGGAVHLDPGGGRGLVAVDARAHEHDFRPLAIPPLSDPNLDGRDEGQMRAAIEAWVRGPLARALARFGARRCLLEVVFPRARDAWSIVDGAARAGHDARWDVRNEIAASLLCDVIEGARHWGDPLLAGALRGCSRAYDVSPGGLTRARIPPIFLYEAISYGASVERAVEHELAGITERER